MSKAGVRPIIRQVRVPYGKSDKGLNALACHLSEVGAQMRPFEDRIEAAKKALKPLAEEFEKVEREICEGRPVEVDCKELFVWDASKVLVRRNDTGEIIERRDMTEDDRQLNSFDSEEEVADVE